MVGGLAATAGRFQHDAEGLLEPLLTYELGQPPRPERAFLSRLQRVGGRGQDLVVTLPAPVIARGQQLLPRTHAEPLPLRPLPLRWSRNRNNSGFVTIWGVGSVIGSRPV